MAFRNCGGVIKIRKKYAQFAQKGPELLPIIARLLTLGSKSCTDIRISNFQHLFFGLSPRGEQIGAKN